MQLNMDFYPRVDAIDWLSRCGDTQRPELSFPVQWISGRESALQALFSTQWADATTEAQACLTGYLAQYHYESYGGYWNKLVKESQELLAKRIGDRLAAVLGSKGWVSSLAQLPLPEMTTAVRASIGKRMVDLRLAKAWDQCLMAKVLVNINRAAMESTYRRKFPKAPAFFEHVLKVYEAGRLPCGWEGDLEKWPEGRLLVH